MDDMEISQRVYTHQSGDILPGMSISRTNIFKQYIMTVTSMSDVGQKRVRLAPNETNICDISRSFFSTFLDWIVLKTVL